MPIYFLCTHSMPCTYHMIRRKYYLSTVFHNLSTGHIHRLLRPSHYPGALASPFLLELRFRISYLPELGFIYKILCLPLCGGISVIFIHLVIDSGPNHNCDRLEHFIAPFVTHHSRQRRCCILFHIHEGILPIIINTHIASAFCRSVSVISPNRLVVYS